MRSISAITALTIRPLQARSGKGNTRTEHERILQTIYIGPSPHGKEENRLPSILPLRLSDLDIWADGVPTRKRCTVRNLHPVYHCYVDRLPTRRGLILVT